MAGYLSLQLHFLATGVRELFRPPPERVPSPRLRHRVHGSTDYRGYLEVGTRSWTSIERLLREVGREPETFESILDYGCGSGRTVRAIPRNTGSTPRAITGIDIDDSAIRWGSRHLPGIRFATVRPLPPTPFADASFDLIYAISVFTHIDETMQFALLGEMRRLLKPRGVLIASVQGEYHRSVRKRPFDLSTGFAYVAGDRGLFKKDGLPRFYQDAQHTRAYVEREWSKYFEILLYRDRGIADHQDAVVMTRA